MMKKIFIGLIGLIGLSACSSENIILEAFKVYDVSNTPCKTALSKTETRPDFFAAQYEQPTTLNMELGKDGVARCRLEDVKGNCGVKKIYVNCVNQANRLILLVYNNPVEVPLDCICKYDVDFKVSITVPGNYDLRVYYARSDMKYDENDLAYKGEVNLSAGKKTSVKLNPEMMLREK